MRIATNKETSQLDQRGPHPYKHKAIMLGNGKRKTPLMGGVFETALFHFQKPIDIIKSISLYDLELIASFYKLVLS